MGFNWYQAKTQGFGTQLYPDATGFDLREELHSLLFGDSQEAGIGQQVLIRRLTDSKCVCFDKDSGSPDPGCRYCKGEGYLWTETMNVVYLARNAASVLGATVGDSQLNSLAQRGFTDDNRAVAYCEYDVFPDYERYLIPTTPAPDKLFELKVDADGQLVTLPWAGKATWGALDQKTYGQFDGQEFDHLSDTPGWIGGVVRTAKWKVKGVFPHRGDNGRIELFEIALEAESV